MDMKQYKQRLLELETRLSARAAREREAARGQVLDTPGDIGDASVVDEGQSEDFC
jgi:hypothetical protein